MYEAPRSRSASTRSGSSGCSARRSTARAPPGPAAHRTTPGARAPASIKNDWAAPPTADTIANPDRPMIQRSLAPEEIRDLAAEEQHAAERERVGGDDQLPVVVGEMKCLRARAVTECSSVVLGGKRSRRFGLPRWIRQWRHSRTRAPARGGHKRGWAERFISLITWSQAHGPGLRGRHLQLECVGNAEALRSSSEHSSAFPDSALSGTSVGLVRMPPAAQRQVFLVPSRAECATCGSPPSRLFSRNFGLDGSGSRSWLIRLLGWGWGLVAV